MPTDDTIHFQSYRNGYNHDFTLTKTIAKSHTPRCIHTNDFKKQKNLYEKWQQKN